ncbi:30S ribosomal protein S7 [endosymbiont GvMRE of Glomus versiforme]|uniref:small ribosomal subunit protein uS7 n=1 Tax=endosymbiont GvMRE of Glomus versiforme TaxID=2039283 RepID=UPI000EC0FFA6|nr:30S ribosomal protein S7 [endosymbiont GvMRE of Glomus versiforme]RHZ35377.1 30S ribosomal protein S7 [endosymbiont GvMRE of Glomus versiforme]
MRKKKIIKEHLIKPDLKYSSENVSKLINKIMKDGEKRKAKKIVYQAAQLVEKKNSLPFLDVLEKALANIKPTLITISRKFGSLKQRIPVEIKGRRSIKLALKWLIEGARKRGSNKPMSENLAEEIKDAYNKSGEAFKKKENIHKEVMSNMTSTSSLKIK